MRARPVKETTQPRRLVGTSQRRRAPTITKATVAISRVNSPPAQSGLRAAYPTRPAIPRSSTKSGPREGAFVETSAFIESLRGLTALSPTRVPIIDSRRRERPWPLPRRGPRRGRWHCRLVRARPGAPEPAQPEGSQDPTTPPLRGRGRGSVKGCGWPAVWPLPPGDAGARDPHLLRPVLGTGRGGRSASLRPPPARRSASDQWSKVRDEAPPWQRNR